MLEHQCVDTLLRRVRAATLLADFDEGRIATREVKNAAGDQAVVQDHVGLVERAKRIQREQAGVARAGADEGHGSAMDSGRLGQCRLQLAFGIERSLPSQVAGDLAAEQRLQKTATLAEITPACANTLAIACSQCSQRTERSIEQGLDAFAHEAGEDRCCAAGRDRDHQGTAVNHGGNLEARELGVVDDIDEQPSRFRRGGNGPVKRAVAGCRYDQPGVIEPGFLECGACDG